jgi:hypothetical protein
MLATAFAAQTFGCLLADLPVLNSIDHHTGYTLI